MRRTIVLLLIIVQAYFTVATTSIRGYFSVGGEWLIVPCYMLAVLLIKQIKIAWKEYRG